MNKIKIRDFYLMIMLSILAISFSLPVLSYDLPSPVLNEQIQNSPQVLVQPSTNIPIFNSPTCLLVGLNSNELSYREISNLSGFELFNVPYRSDIKTLVEQIKPTQIIIKHPSGFIGLYSIDGQLIRGVQTTYENQVAIGGGAMPPSIIQPTEANPPYESQFYPGSATGSVSRGGVGYAPPPKGREVLRHFLKLASFLGLAPFQYPGYFNASRTYNQEKLLPALALPNVPVAIGAAATYADAKLDAAEYENVRNQPRDYMFQPVIEGY